MSGCLEHIAAFTFVLLTCTLTGSQVQGQTRGCSLFSRPHPKGLCGSRLALAHENLCFLVRQRYHLFFPHTKRSDLMEANDFDNVPLSLLKDDDNSHDGLGSAHEYLHDIPSSLTSNRNEFSSISSVSETGNIPKDSTASAFLHILTKRNPQPQRSLVCDCCYNHCSPEVLALYC